MSTEAKQNVQNHTKKLRLNGVVCTFEIERYDLNDVFFIDILCVEQKRKHCFAYEDEKVRDKVYDFVDESLVKNILKFFN